MIPVWFGQAMAQKVNAVSAGIVRTLLAPAVKARSEGGKQPQLLHRQFAPKGSGGAGN